MKRTDVVSMRSLLSGSARYKPASSHRGFVWTPADVAQLLVDLELAAKADQDGDDEDGAPAERFYLGIMTVSHERGGQYIVLDGQQRLTTLALIIAFARDRIDDNGERQRLDRMLVRRSMTKSPEPRVRLSPEDHAWFSHFILPPGATRRLPANAPIGSPRALLLAARFMEQAFLSYRQDDILTIADYVRRHAAFVRTVAEAGMDWTPQLPAPEPQQALPPPSLFVPRPTTHSATPAAPRQGESLHEQYARRAQISPRHAQLFGVAAE
jgi:hypothetical protein